MSENKRKRYKRKKEKCKRKGEKYIGSVLFYKHLILSVIALLILVPTVLCILFGIRSKRLFSEKQEIEERLMAMEEEMVSAEVQSVPIENSGNGLEEGQSEDWKLILVNESHPLKADFEVELQTVTGGQQVDARIVEPLYAMMKQMRQEGLQPVVCSGYRTIEKQSRLFDEYIDEKLKLGWEYKNAFYKAKRRISIPGTSEHHTGLAVDIVGKTYQILDDAQADTREAIWLEEHCAEYGFILRYPENKTDITGIDYESWHFRYVGKEAAAYIMEEKLTLEEYLTIGKESYQRLQ